MTPFTLLTVGLLALGAGSPVLPRASVRVTLTEWKVELSDRTTPEGTVAFTITNDGNVPHAFEIEGAGVERETQLIQPGASDTLTLDLRAGSYTVYCPVGNGSHEKLGMQDRLSVVSRALHVTGGGAVVQILPGPFPFPDSAAPILQTFGDEKEGLESQVKNGPYSNNVARVSGSFGITAWDNGATGDSVDGIADFTTRDGARWKLVLDRVQTKDVPHHPRFGGVIFGLYYHGNTGVHTPLVPTINSAVALWAVGHLYRNGTLVTDHAMTHVMLLSHTRRDGDFALACWDCSKNRVDELQLQVLPGPGEPPLDSPGGFLFVNWERSGARKGS